MLYHTHNRSRDESFAKNIESGLPELVKLTASYAHCPKHTRKIIELLDLWKTEGHFTAAAQDKLVAVAHDAPRSATDESGATGKDQNAVNTTTSRTAKNAPYLMPSMHGDATAAWYDLPAANWLPVMEPNSTRPMNPEMIKPLQFKSGPAEAHLVDAVKTLLADADRLYAKEHAIGEDDGVELDQMGQPIVRDEITGEIVGGQTYYGWSRGFCKKMKLRRTKDDKPQDRSRSRDRSGSRSRSRSLSQSVDSRSRSRSPSPRRSKRRRMSGSYSRSRSPSRSRTRSHRRGRSHTGSPSRSRSRSRAGHSRHSRSRDDRSRSPYRARSGGSHARDGRDHIDVKAQHLAPPRGSSNHQFQASFQQPPIPPPPFPMGGDFSGNNNFPGFPLHPPSFNGAWVPPFPPPPIPPQVPGMGFAQAGWMPNMMPGWSGGVPPPPPPPPPPSQAPHPYGQGQYQDQYANPQHGRGGQGGQRGYGQRGGRGRGRGW